MRVTSNTNSTTTSATTLDNTTTSTTTTTTTRVVPPSPIPSTLLPSNTFQSLIQSLSDNSSTRNDGAFDELLNSRLLQHAQTTHQSPPPPRPGFLALHRRSSIRPMKRKWRNSHGTTGEFPLSFDVVYCDGDYYSPAFNVDNILRNDTKVYCSKKSANINIILKFNDQSQDVMDSSFVLTKIVVKAPTQGYTAPCKEGLIFVSHEPIALEATSIYDDYTESDYEELLESGENGRIEDHWPAAYFRLDPPNNYTSLVINPNRSGKFLLVKLLRSEGDKNNIDLQYLGLIGFTGPRSFDAGSLR